MESRNILIPIKKDVFGYRNYIEYIKPYLDVFGMPYEEVAPEDLSERLSRGAALVLLAQQGVSLDERAAQAVVAAIKDGCGLCAVYSSLIQNSEFSEFAEFFEVPSKQVGGEISVDKEHFITRYHPLYESIKLYANHFFYRTSSLRNSEILLSLSGSPLLEVARFGKGRVVLWNTTNWISMSVLGQLHGMDDLFRESIIWAAKKPFVMKGMPAFVGMRVDDVWGAWRNVTPENPLLWMEIANNYGLCPWLGVFQDNINEKATELVRSYVKDGRATAFPHAFSGCEWVGSDIPEDWLWYDHRNERPWSAEVMKKRAERARLWFEEKDIPISKVALAHYYEMSESAIPILLDWGCEFIGIHMPPDATYNLATLASGPYHKLAGRPCSEKRPVYLADYLDIPHNPKIDRKLFNCVTEIRDVRGYELAPTNDVPNTIDSGVRQVRRAIISGVPGVVFTHESCWIQRISPKNWEAEIAGITAGIADLNPVYDTLDNIYKYVRASHNIRIENATVDELGNLKLSVKGVNDMDTKCYMFFDEGDEIITKEHIIPKNMN